ncbi:cmgc ck2 kinase [Fusarium longipes]|uniref:non-specific serine/threonine protein kinase n=1 Tax=Fusarium longipes TaxID=694270 RepID=A0A395SZ11_9HYPO|nr:cmgc ck2 kinase [Fusarium longipes]
MAPIQPAASSGLQNFYDLAPPRRLGRGRHAIVVECRNPSDRVYAMKLFKEDSRDRIAREIEILQYLRSGPNIIQIVDVVQGEEGANIGIVLEYIDNTDYRALYPRFSGLDIRYYTKELLKALEFAHDLGVMHRDLRLIGWSSAEFYQPGDEYSCCVGLWKPPEILLGHEKYDCSVDMWCFGNMLAAMIFRKEPFFHGNSLLDQLLAIAKVLGTERLYRAVEQLEIEMEPQYFEALDNREETPWVSFVNNENDHLATREAIDLVDQLLRFDPRERITASEALRHAYYEDVV